MGHPREERNRDSRHDDHHASRERRETTSHTTSFNQLYQLLSAYHLGTNRCVFLVARWPHIVTTETGQIDFNLLDGPRRLEGIQNFFLVVEVPKQLKGLCLADQVPPHARGTGTIGSEVLGRLPGVA